MNTIIQLSKTDVDGILGYLESQLERIERMHNLLNQFRAGLIRKDIAELTSLQKQFQQESIVRDQLERELEIWKRRIAGWLGSSAGDVTLSGLCRCVDSETAYRIQQKQSQVRERIESFKKEHLATEMLMRECSRMNRKTLEIILGKHQNSSTYNEKGKTNWAPDQGLLSVQL